MECLRPRLRVLFRRCCCLRYCLGTASSLCAATGVQTSSVKRGQKSCSEKEGKEEEIRGEETESEETKGIIKVHTLIAAVFSYPNYTSFSFENINNRPTKCSHAPRTAVIDGRACWCDFLHGYWFTMRSHQRLRLRRSITRRLKRN